VVGPRLVGYLGFLELWLFLALLPSHPANGKIAVYSPLFRDASKILSLCGDRAVGPFLVGPLLVGFKALVPFLLWRSCR
jgi:hypothetical protein